MKIINGKELALEIEENIKKSILKNELDITLAVIIVDGNSASDIYVKNKEKACQRVGIKSKVVRLNNNINQEALENVIKELANDTKINGILLQLPLPNHLDAEKASLNIPVSKDVDGFSFFNLGKLLKNEKGIIPCTPKGIMHIIDSEKYDLSGKHVCIIGRSNIVGKPLALLLINRGATVTVCNSKTRNLFHLTKNSDMVIVATGQAKLLTGENVKKDSFLIDVGISRVDNKIVGDIDFDSVKDVCGYITPVPGGVGPLTIAMLLQNTLELSYGFNK